MNVIIVFVFICFLLLICFFSVYFGQCSRYETAAGRENRQVSACGLDTAVIDTFPILLYSAVQDLKIGRGALECAVCLNEFQDDETLRLIPKCDHVFHPDCIDVWLVSHITCPVCRANLTPESGNSDKLPGEENPRSELSEAPNQVSINVVEDQISEENVNGSRTNSPARGKISGKFPKSHSTGHSLVQIGDMLERYTLRMPEDVKNQMMISCKHKRTASCFVVLARERSSRKGYRGSWEGSSREKRYLERQLGAKSDQ